jgi:uncharacterized SAM-binding protein YcdF (DUF218 family)
MIKKLWSKRIVRILTYFLAVCILLFAFRGPILRSMGRYLVAQDAWEPTQLVVVLGGNSYERGLAAVDIAQQHPEVKFLATGGNRPMQILALDTSMFEAELTRHWMVKKGVDPSRIDILTSATSTGEEADEVLTFCKKYNISHVTIVSSTYHLRRVKWIFHDLFEENRITTKYYGANSEGFTPDTWWQNEEGLIVTNNEYVKLLYYMVK